jgi:hypothetical protein
MFYGCFSSLIKIIKKLCIHWEKEIFIPSLLPHAPAPVLQG